MELAGFNKFLQTHETFQFAVIEAVHRYFYDNCFSVYSGKMLDTEEAKYFFDLLQTMSADAPDWRYRIKKKLERYDGWEKTLALNVNCKPKRFFHIKLNSEQKVKECDATKV